MNVNKLLANPEKYENQEIEVAGFWRRPRKQPWEIEITPGPFEPEPVLHISHLPSKTNMDSNRVARKFYSQMTYNAFIKYGAGRMLLEAVGKFVRSKTYEWELINCSYIRLARWEYRIIFQQETIDLHSLQTDFLKSNNIINVSNVVGSSDDFHNRLVLLAGVLLSAPDFFIFPNYSFHSKSKADPRLRGIRIYDQKVINFAWDHEDFHSILQRRGSRPIGLPPRKRDKNEFRPGHINNIVLAGRLQKSDHDIFKYEITDIKEIVFQLERENTVILYKFNENPYIDLP